MPTEPFQRALRDAYANGAAGAFVASLVWLAAAVTLHLSTVSLAFPVLFFGGMLIFPLSVLVLKFMMKRSASAPGNIGATIVIDTIPPMIVGFFAAWLLLPHHTSLVMPVATLAVGAHYFGFRSAYGDNAFVVLAGIVCLLALVSALTPWLSSLLLLYLVAGTELIFGVVLLQRSAR
ncbi:DUF7010 family protein [Alteromonas sp. CYL-A6]|uniref:DUF7010 family protein n=1 Tax=Alteromonas nitratireducens TaxID=3390813 RepID=UPI0034C2928D